MIRILMIFLATFSLATTTGLAAQESDRSVIALATHVLAAHALLPAEDNDCQAMRPSRSEPHSTSRLSDMLLHHRTVSRLPFNPDLPTPSRSYPLEPAIHSGHCS